MDRPHDATDRAGRALGRIVVILGPRYTSRLLLPEDHGQERPIYGGTQVPRDG